MKKFRFLLLDAGPIIKLFELDLWEKFIERCDVTIARTVVEEAGHTGKRDVFSYITFPFERAAEERRINIIDMDTSLVQRFHNMFDLQYKAIIDPGEKETLAFVCNSSENWLVCSADKAVFRVLGLLGRADQGISLEEVLQEIGLTQKLEPQYTKKFREKYTLMGQIDSVQDKGLR